VIRDYIAIAVPGSAGQEAKGSAPYARTDAQSVGVGPPPHSSTGGPSVITPGGPFEDGVGERENPVAVLDFFLDLGEPTCAAVRGRYGWAYNNDQEAWVLIDWTSSEWPRRLRRQALALLMWGETESEGGL